MKGNSKLRNLDEVCASSKSKFFLRMSTDEKISGCAREGLIARDSFLKFMDFEMFVSWLLLA